MVQLNLSCVQSSWSHCDPDARISVEPDATGWFDKMGVPIDVDADGKLSVSVAAMDGKRLQAVRENAQCDFDEGDALGLVVSVGSDCALALVFDNISKLRERGIYEEALFHAWTGSRVNNSGFTIDVLDWMFGLADREKLRACGDELPPGDSFTIYRGVAGPRNTRRVRSFSWTLDFDKAVWFAKRLEMDDPAVYRATIRRDEILAYCNERQEQEIICRPRSCKQVLKLMALTASM